MNASDLLSALGNRALNSMQVEDECDLILISPSKYLDCRTVQPCVHMTDEPRMFRVTFTGEVTGFSADKKPLSEPLLKSRMCKRIEMKFVDGANNEVVYSHFGNAHSLPKIEPNKPTLILSTVKRFRSLSIQNITPVPAHAVGTIWPVYKGIPGMVASDRVVSIMDSLRANDELYESLRSKAVAKIIGQCCMSESDLLEQCNSQFNSLQDLIDTLHFPSTPESGEIAVQEAKTISAVAIQASALRANVRRTHPQAPIVINDQTVHKVLDRVKEPLTVDQKNVITAVIDRIRSPQPMNGLLSGDVGTGKTLAFLVPAISAHMEGYKVAIMAPTQILADQIVSNIVQRFGDLVDCEQVFTGIKVKNPNAILVGTSGISTILNKNNIAANLIIADEQHKMATTAKEAGIKDWTHILEVSATPIPRSLASALYGGMDLFNLRECPVRKTIHSYVVDRKSSRNVIEQIDYALRHNERAAIVYPRVDGAEVKTKTANGSEKTEITFGAESAAASLEKRFPGKVTTLHGQLDGNNEELKRRIQTIKSGETPLIVATTIIETGVDIPSISVMVVRDADRFGISQLHQLRGRLVRNGGEGVFLMMVEDLEQTAENSPNTLERLKALASTTDGYKLAEIDLINRGFGELGGVVQSGATSTLFKMVQMTSECFIRSKLKSLKIDEDTSPQEFNTNTDTTIQNRLF